MISIIDRLSYNGVEYMTLIRISCNIVIWLDNLMQKLNIIVNTHWVELHCHLIMQKKKCMLDHVC